MKSAAIALISFMGLANVIQGALIVDREFDVASLAEGIPMIVTYSLYNTFGK